MCIKTKEFVLTSENEVNKERKLSIAPEFYMPLNSAMISLINKYTVDSRSVYISNLGFSVTEEQLKKHFISCGAINSINIPINKFDGLPKGFAYVEFAVKESVETALILNNSVFRGRSISVLPKNTRRSGISTTNSPSKGPVGLKEVGISRPVIKTNKNMSVGT